MALFDRLGELLEYGYSLIAEFQSHHALCALDAQPPTAGWMMPRGGSRLWWWRWACMTLLLEDEGVVVVVAVTDERQAGIVFRTAVRIGELSP